MLRRDAGKEGRREGGKEDGKEEGEGGRIDSVREQGRGEAEM